MNIDEEIEGFLQEFFTQYFEGQSGGEIVMDLLPFIPKEKLLGMLAYWAECQLADICFEDIEMLQVDDKGLKYMHQQFKEAMKTIGVMRKLAP